MASQSQLFKRRADSVTGNEIGPRHKRSISHFRFMSSLLHYIEISMRAIYNLKKGKGKNIITPDYTLYYT